jgi:hypothetical protein
MPLFPQLVLIIWFPIVLLLFATVKPRRAVIVANVAAMLVLPNGGFVLPGLPDYSKTSGTSAAVLLGIVLFDFQRLVNFRPRWFDLPVVVWCGSYLVSSMSNDLGIYDGLSSATFQVLLWGVPYLTGRLYLTDLAGVRELTTAMIVGGLIYLPLCLYESKFSPVLEGKIYGMASQPYALPRFGLGYRPIVFMNTGLALGMWMIAVALAAYWRWFCGETRRIMKLTPGLVAALLLLGAIMTKSLGAWQLLAGGVGVLHLAKRTKKTWPVLLLVLLPLIYMGLRIPKFWSGQNMVAFTRQYFGEERAQSLETRVLAEDQLVDRALERPVWGWGGQGRSRVKNEAGADSVLTDGYWVIALGVAGFAGLAGLTATFLLPTYLFLRRIPVRHWSDPKVAPASALAVLLSLYMLDCLSNAMPNLVYAMAAGGITGLSAVHISTHRRRADELFEEGEAFRAEGDALAAEESYRAALILYAADSDPDAEGRAVQATCLEALATHLLASGRPDEAEGSLRDALAIRAALLCPLWRPSSPPCPPSPTTWRPASAWRRGWRPSGGCSRPPRSPRRPRRRGSPPSDSASGSPSTSPTTSTTASVGPTASTTWPGSSPPASAGGPTRSPAPWVWRARPWRSPPSRPPAGTPSAPPSSTRATGSPPSTPCGSRPSWATAAPASTTSSSR